MVHDETDFSDFKCATSKYCALSINKRVNKPQNIGKN